MHDDHAATDKKTIERSANAYLSARAQFEEPAAERTGVRKAEIRAMVCQQLRQPRIVRKDVNGPRLDFGEHALVEVLDPKRHNVMLANTLTLRKGLG